MAKSTKLRIACKVFSILACVLVVGLILRLTYADNIVERESLSDVDITGIPLIDESVTIGRHTYTRENPLRIVELVSEDYQADMGYQLGAEENVVISFDEAKEMNALSLFRNALQTTCGHWHNLSPFAVEFYGTYIKNYYPLEYGHKWGDLDEFWINGKPEVSDYRFVYKDVKYSNCNSTRLLYRALDENGQEQIYETKNIFALSVFGDYNMVDKISCEVMTMSEFNELSKEEIDSINLLYINTSGGTVRQSGGNSPIKQMCDLKFGPFTINSFRDLGQDLNAELTWYIFERIVNEDLSMIMDTVTPAAYLADNSNMLKLLYMLNGSDKEIFRKHFWEVKDSDTEYHGNFGSVQIVPSEEGSHGTINLTYRKYYYLGSDMLNEDALLPWKQNMFTDENMGTGTDNFLFSLSQHFGGTIEEWKKYYFLSWDGGSYEYGRGGNVLDNVLFASSWDDMLTVPGKDMGYVEGKTGSSMDDMYNLYGDNTRVGMGSGIRYILGDYVRLTKDDAPIQVLEIEPAGTYVFDKLDKAKVMKIFKYLKISTRGLELSNDNCGRYVEVHSVAMNEFIASTEDVKSNYDLVYIGDTVDEAYKNIYLSDTYAEHGGGEWYRDWDTWTNYDLVYSGNDLTDKACQRLKDYIEGEMPLVMADSIYGAYEGIVNSESKLYGLVRLAQLYPTVMNESLTKGRAHYYIRRPRLTVPQEYMPDYSQGMEGGNIIERNLSPENLSGFGFNISGQANMSYNLKIYADRDGNGMFNYSSDESNELIFNRKITMDTNGSYTAWLSLPKGIRGYLKWNAVLTDESAGRSRAASGAFVVGYTEDEMIDVRLLQIAPEYGKTLSLKYNEKFLKLFNAASGVTGLRLSPENMTEVTPEEFEKFYDPDEGGVKYLGGEDDQLVKSSSGGYDIIVLGFGDSYGYEDISDENGALSNLLYYIETGNPVLMAHDVMSYTAYSDSNVTNKRVSFKNIDKAQLSLPGGNITFGNVEQAKERYRNWSYNLTSSLRNIVGMDRYNVALTTANKNTLGTYTQGYGNSTNIWGNERYHSNAVSQINNGQINMYPYEIGKKDVPVARTHSQYYQLNLEEFPDGNDVVVWYALSSDDAGNESDKNKLNNYYELSGNDALNNYYIYSKGNITYTGAGHSKLDDSEIELRLFVNTIIKALGATNNLPYVEFNEALKVDTHTYETAVRDGELPEKIYFTAVDDDFFGEEGSLRESYVFIDMNGDGKYDEDDILIKAYDGIEDDYLQNNVKNELDFRDIVEGMDEEKDNTIKKLFEENKLVVTVQVKDNSNGIGSSVLNLVNKDLFELN